MQTEKQDSLYNQQTKFELDMDNPKEEDVQNNMNPRSMEEILVNPRSMEEMLVNPRSMEEMLVNPRSMEEMLVNPRSMEEMLSSILKDLEFAEVSLQSTSRLIEPTVVDSESNQKPQEIAETKFDPIMKNHNPLSQFLQEDTNVESAFTETNKNDCDFRPTFNEEELKQLLLRIEPKENDSESPEHFKEEKTITEETSIGLNITNSEGDSDFARVNEEELKQLLLSVEPKENDSESPEHFEEEKTTSNEASTNITSLEDCDLTSNKELPEDKVVLKIPLPSSNPYINFVQDFQAKYDGDEVSPSMRATLAFIKWRKMGKEEKQIYSNIKSHCDKNIRVQKLRNLIKSLNASEESIFESSHY